MGGIQNFYLSIFDIKINRGICLTGNEYVVVAGVLHFRGEKSP
jgi:hypothetical protein